MLFEAPIEEISEKVDKNVYIGKSIDVNVLNDLGAFIVKGLFSQEIVSLYRNFYLSGKNVNFIKTPPSQHLTEIIIKPDHKIWQVCEQPAFINTVRPLFNGNVGATYVRLLNKEGVTAKYEFPLHQDISYQTGFFDKYSVFVALTEISPENGGICVYPGTHNYGYLGATGHIKDPLPANFPKIKPHLSPGDALIMHSALWHFSPQNISGKTRLYLEIHIQNLEDPTTRIKICGSRKSAWVMHATAADLIVSNPNHNEDDKEIDRLFERYSFQKIKIEGLYFEIFDDESHIGSGVFCFKNENDEVLGAINEIVVGGCLTIGFHGTKTKTITEIVDIDVNKTWVVLKDIDGKKYRINGTVQKYTKI